MATAVLLSEHDLSSWAADEAVPGQLPYGAEALSVHGLEPVWRQRRWRGTMLKAALVAEGRSGMPIRTAIDGAAPARSADVVIAMLEQYAWAPAMMKRHRVGYQLPIVALLCWDVENALQASPAKLVRMRRRYEGVDLILVWSANQVPIVEERLGVPAAAVRFGTDVDYFTTGVSNNRSAIVAIGQDRGRDYHTLVDAARGSPFSVDIVCRPQNVAGLDVPPNVTIHGPVRHEEYRTWLKRAQVVVIPIHPMAYPTGQSVLLEAMAMGRCCVTTESAAIADYVSDDTVVVVPPHDPGALREATLALLEDDKRREEIERAARERVRASFTTGHMWGDVARAIASGGIGIASKSGLGSKAVQRLR